MTRVVDVHKKNLNKIGYADLKDWLKDPNHIYIGRNNVYVNGTFNSKWRNRFSVKKYGRDGCLKEYEKFIRENKELLGQIDELDGKVLGCWCKPLPCHGDILLKILNETK